MSALTTMWTVLLKELRDIGRDRRTLGLTLLMGPLLFPALILGMGSLAEKRARTQIEQVLEVPTVGAERAPNLVAFLATRGIKAVEAPADLEDALRDQRVDVGLRISESFAEDWHAGRPALVEVVLDSSQRDSGIPGSRLRGALAAYGGQVGALRLLARGIDASVAQPVRVSASPAERIRAGSVARDERRVNGTPVRRAVGNRRRYRGIAVRPRHRDRRRGRVGLHRRLGSRAGECVAGARRRAADGARRAGVRGVRRKA